MKDLRRQEFQPGLIESIPVEKREEFKKIIRHKRYLASGLFFFLWNMTLFYLGLAVTIFLWWLLSPLKEFWNSLFEGPILGLFIFNFFLTMMMSYSLRKVRERLNQIGLHVIHGAFIGSTLIFLCIYLLLRR